MTDKKTDMLFALQERPRGDQRIDRVINGQERAKIHWGNIRKILLQATVASFIIPFAIAGIDVMSRNLVTVVNDAKAGILEHGGEFDPSMGAEISSENGRALVVVHEGYGLDRNPWRYKNNSEYKDYLRRLDAKKQMYYENGDVVILVYDETAWNETGHTPRENTLQLATMTGNAIPNMQVRVGDVRYDQSLEEIFYELRNAGIENLEMAGETRGGCAYQMALQLENGGFKIGWCDDCAYPALDETDPEARVKFPALPPIDN